VKSILIFGAGLAGTCLAQQFLRRGHKVTLIDSGENHSSKIAAGMVNPMVFRRMNKSWRLDEFLPEAKSFYQGLEQELNTKFYHPIVIRRFFSSLQEKEMWQERCQEEAYFPYLEPTTEEDLCHEGAINLFGSGRVKQAFWIDAETWTAQQKIYFAKKEALIIEEFAPNEWQPQSKTYRNITYDNVIFCMGYRQKSERTFGNLPVEQTKGQTLLIQSKLLPSEESLNRKCFVLPIGNQQYKVGATYEWNNDSLEVTQAGKEQLLNMLGSLGNYEPEILEQKAGIRPTVLDRRPLVGEHPDFKGVYIFNGLGTKGYMMAPTLARELVEHMLDGCPIDPEIDIQRFSAK
jgi:glycine/D-amino acid oxidase-like deaminating enzyme